jgi:acetyl-CoA carboxylase biotin carboxyl carrier protein
MSLTAAEVDRIIQLLDGSRFDRLRLEMDGLRLELARSGGAPDAAPRPTLPASEPIVAVAAAPDKPREAGLVEVKSPLLGIFYHAPRPGEPPFVTVGARVEPDTIIGIIEVMKLMNSARAGVTGEVVEILAPNGELVEHGAVLLLVRPER